MLIGLIGYKGSGKSEVAKVLEQRGFIRRPFAGPIKDMARALGLTEEQVNGSEKEKPLPQLFNMTPRKILQSLGTEWGRSLSPAFWTNCWLLRYEPGRLTVIDDVRFPNEVELVEKLGGHLWRIERPGVGLADGHESEMHIDSLRYHRLLRNEGNRDYLHVITCEALVSTYTSAPHQISA